MYDEIKKIYKNLSLNYNRQPDKETYELWYDTLKDYDIYYLQQTYKKIVREDKFFPTLTRYMEVLREIPKHNYSENEKIERWEFIPKDCREEITEIELMTNEELNEINKLMEVFNYGK